MLHKTYPIKSTPESGQTCERSLFMSITTVIIHIGFPWKQICRVLTCVQEKRWPVFFPRVHLLCRIKVRENTGGKREVRLRTPGSFPHYQMQREGSTLKPPSSQRPDTPTQTPAFRAKRSHPQGSLCNQAHSWYPLRLSTRKRSMPVFIFIERGPKKGKEVELFTSQLSWHWI